MRAPLNHGTWLAGARQAAAVALALGLGAGLLPVHASAQGQAAATKRATSGSAQPAPAAPSYATRPEVIAFIDEMVAKHGFERAELQRVFSRIRRLDRVVSLMTPGGGGAHRRSWPDYRSRFIEPVRINGGLEFWQANGADLKLASAFYGVPEAIIVAIIGVETIYGRNTGNFRVVESLATLAFDFPSRAPYFRSELEQFLLFARENGVDPLRPEGSYAGAMGTPQFMPGSIRRFAVDHDRDGRIDLIGSKADAIGSVASFLKQHGWIEGKPTHYPVRIADGSKVKALVDAGPEPSFTIAQLNAAGISSPDPIPADELLVLADLVVADAPSEHVLGTRNFYAITRYNRSYFYAMAVIDLATELQRRKAADAS